MATTSRTLLLPAFPPIFESRLDGFLKEGLTLAGRKYEFLAYSSRCGNDPTPCRSLLRRSLLRRPLHDLQ